MQTGPAEAEAAADDGSVLAKAGGEQSGRTNERSEASQNRADT